MRNILRKSAQSGVSSDEVRWALGRLKELAEQEADPSLAFEFQRWSVHVGCMDEAA